MGALPVLTVEKAAQTYTRIDEFTYRYRSGTFEAELVVDDDGIVAQYARGSAPPWRWGPTTPNRSTAGADRPPMTTRVALLRGINVGGHNRLR